MNFPSADSMAVQDIDIPTGSMSSEDIIKLKHTNVVLAESHFKLRQTIESLIEKGFVTEEDVSLVRQELGFD